MAAEGAIPILFGPRVVGALTELRLWRAARQESDLCSKYDTNLGLASTKKKKRMSVDIHPSSCTCEACEQRKADASGGLGSFGGFGGGLGGRPRSATADAPSLPLPAVSEGSGGFGGLAPPPASNGRPRAATSDGAGGIALPAPGGGGPAGLSGPGLGLPGPHSLGLQPPTTRKRRASRRVAARARAGTCVAGYS